MNVLILKEFICDIDNKIVSLKYYFVLDIMIKRKKLKVCNYAEKSFN